jgi:hypothetical protein
LGERPSPKVTRNPAIPIHTVPEFIAYARLNQAAKNGNHATRRHCLISKGGSAKVVTSSICLSVNGCTVERFSAITPIGTPSRSSGTPSITATNEVLSFAGLRARRERPHSRAAEQRYEVAPFHSITSSARASSVDGISRSNALAVWRLMTSSSLVDCMTGKSPGLVPLRTRPA